MATRIPAKLRSAGSTTETGAAWLEQLPAAIAELAQRWSLTLGEPFDGAEVSCAWVAPARRADGTSAVLKLGLPHFEAEHELDGLRYWSGDPTVGLLDSDAEHGAMLLECCEPGTHLRTLPEAEQDVQIAKLLLRLWRPPPEKHSFRPLSALLTT